MTKETPFPDPLSDSYVYWHKLNNIKARIDNVMIRISRNSQLEFGQLNDDGIVEDMDEGILLNLLEPILIDFEILVQELKDCLDDE